MGAERKGSRLPANSLFVTELKFVQIEIGVDGRTARKRHELLLLLLLLLLSETLVHLLAVDKNKEKKQ